MPNEAMPPDMLGITLVNVARCEAVVQNMGNDKRIRQGQRRQVSATEPLPHYQMMEAAIFLLDSSQLEARIFG
jgi:hypothetical protein